MLFVITAVDREGSLQLRMATREAHFTYVKETGAVRLGGPFLNAQGEMAGSMIIIEAADLAAARSWQANDPYAKAGLFQSSDLRPWKATANFCEAKAVKYWLFKTEPETFSWEMQKKRGAKGEPWSGVRNHQAKLNMMAMKKGDLGFFYHSGDAREIVGIVEVIAEYKPDPTDETGKFGLVDVKAVKDLPKPVTLAQAKADPKLKDMTLVTFSRLSVQPVTEAQWKHVCKLGGVT